MLSEEPVDAARPKRGSSLQVSYAANLYAPLARCWIIVAMVAGPSASSMAPASLTSDPYCMCGRTESTAHAICEKLGDTCVA